MLQAHESDPNFLSNQWWVWMGLTRSTIPRHRELVRQERAARGSVHVLSDGVGARVILFRSLYNRCSTGARASILIKDPCLRGMTTRRRHFLSVRVASVVNSFPLRRMAKATRRPLPCFPEGPGWDVGVELLAVHRKDDIFFLNPPSPPGFRGRRPHRARFRASRARRSPRQTHFFLERFVDHRVAEAEQRPADAAVFFDVIDVAPRGVDGDREADDCAPETIAAFTPTTQPSRSTIGPPELPGLIAASVWMRPRISCGGASGSVCAVMERESPETMPTETVLRKMPSALPIAMSDWPSSSLSHRRGARRGACPRRSLK